jgi:hypothetical protein
MRATTLLAAGGLATGLSALGIVAVQAATTIPPNTLHGCVQGSTRTLRQVYVSPTSGTTCSSGFQVIWPNGADKDQPVTAGPSGLDAEQVINETTVSYPDGTFADVQCPSDHPYVISGGGFIQDNSASLRDSYPVIPGPGGQFPQGWEVSVTFPAAITGGGVTSATVRVYAICAR